MDGLEVQGINGEGAEPVKIEAAVASYRGRRAVRIVNIEGPGAQTGEQVLGIVKTSHFQDGTIEADVAGVPRQGANPLWASHSASRITVPGMKPSTCA
jgi:hypothetical protein